MSGHEDGLAARVAGADAGDGSGGIPQGHLLCDGNAEHARVGQRRHCLQFCACWPAGEIEAVDVARGQRVDVNGEVGVDENAAGRA